MKTGIVELSERGQQRGLFGDRFTRLREQAEGDAVLSHLVLAIQSALAEGDVAGARKLFNLALQRVEGNGGGTMDDEATAGEELAAGFDFQKPVEPVKESRSYRPRRGGRTVQLAESMSFDDYLDRIRQPALPPRRLPEDFDAYLVSLRASGHGRE